MLQMYRLYHDDNTTDCSHENTAQLQNPGSRVNFALGNKLLDRRLIPVTVISDNRGLDPSLELPREGGGAHNFKESSIWLFESENFQLIENAFR